jgi:hypothetical protein
MLKILILSAFFISSAFAQDMSRNEKPSEAYRTRSDGSSEYIGGCLTHEDYEGRKFKRSSMILETLSPSDLSISELNRRLHRIDSSLLLEISNALQFDLADFREFVDDITIDRIQMSKRLTSSLVRANVGIGGGNGSYLVFSQVGNTYKLLSQTLDGDLEYCDIKVWMKIPR